MLINEDELAYEEHSQTDVELDDDDFEGEVGDELFTKNVGESILAEVNRTVGGRNGPTEEGNRLEAAKANDENDEEDLHSEEL